MESHEGKKGPYVRRALLVVALAASALALESRYDSGEIKDNHNPLMEVYCGDVDGLTPQEVNNWSHGGVEKPWDSEGGLAVFTYNLQAGENLAEVAKCYFMDSDEGIKSITKSNDLKNANIVQPGKITIRITKPVQVGLTKEIGSVGEMAYHTGFTTEQILAANGKELGDDWNPSEGDVIQLPIQRTSANIAPLKTTTTTEAPALPGETITRIEQMRAFKEKWGDYAKDVEEKFGINQNVVLAQALLESDFGSSVLTQEASGLFGMKAHKGAKTTPYWGGETFEKPTKEYLTAEQMKDPFWKERIIEVLGTGANGTTEVEVMQDFRSYNGEDAFSNSFNDYGYKITEEKTYQDAEKAIDDPLDYIKKVAEAGYANDPEYIAKVTGIWEALNQIDSDADNGDGTTTTTAVTTTTSPRQPGEGIGVTFENFPDEPRDEKLKNTIIEGAALISVEDFDDFKEVRFLNKSATAQEITDAIDSDYYEKALNSRQFTADEIKNIKVVLHFWANGMELDEVAGTKDKAPVGNSHEVTLETQVKSWANRYLDTKNTNSPVLASANILIGDKENDSETWLLTSELFSRTLHAGRGIMDKGSSEFPDLNNDGTIAIEVQADSIYNMEPEQFRDTVNASTLIIIESGKVTEDMSLQDIREAVESTVVGHGKNPSKFDSKNGIEWGFDYREPVIDAVSQLIYKVLGN